MSSVTGDCHINVLQSNHGPIHSRWLDQENVDCVEVEIQVKREYFFHLAATYMPTVCLIVISEIVLFIDDDHFDTIVMVALTTMLVMYTLYQSVSASLPQTSYLKLIDIWLLFGLLIPFVIFILSIFLKVNK